MLSILVTVQQVCALAALTVRKHRLEGKNPISEADLEWIFARNYEGTEQLRRMVTVQQVCAFTALTVRKLRLEGKNPIGTADLEWIFARNCEGTEQLRKFEIATIECTLCKHSIVMN